MCPAVHRQALAVVMVSWQQPASTFTQGTCASAIHGSTFTPALVDRPIGPVWALLSWCESTGFNEIMAATWHTVPASKDIE